MDIFKYITHIFKNGSNYVLNVISNYFYKKNIKPYTSSITSTKLESNIQRNCISCNIEYLKLDNINLNFINFLELKKSSIFFYLNRPIAPIFIFTIKNCILNLNNNFNYTQTNKPIKEVNLNLKYAESFIINGCEKISRILNFVSDRQKYIFKNFKIIFDNLTLNLNALILTKNNDKYIINIKTTSLYLENTKLIRFLNIKSIYTKNDKIINLDIETVKICINDSKTNIVDKFLKTISNIKISTSDDNIIDFRIRTKFLKLYFMNFNSFRMDIKNLDYILYKKVYLEKVFIKSFKKNIGDLDEVIFDILEKSVKLKKGLLNIYNTLGHKFFLTFQKYIKKTVSKKVKLLDKKILDRTYINGNIIGSYIAKKKYSVPKPKSRIDNLLNNMPNNLVESFIIKKPTTDNILKFIDTNYIDTTLLADYKILVNTLKIHFYNKLEKYKWVLKTCEYKVITDKKKIININDWKIYDVKNNIVIKKLCDTKSNFININYINNKVMVNCNSMYLNVKPNTFIKLFYCINQNIKAIDKLFYHSYNSEDINETFFINYISINSFKLKAFYYPNKCNYAGFLIGNFGDIYKIINYEDVNLKTKQIMIHYPYNFSEMFRRILNDWIKDIKKNQIKNVIKGTKFKSAISNLPTNYTKQLISIIEKTINNVYNYFNN